MKSIRPLTLQLGHVIGRCIKIDMLSNMVKIWQFLTFLPVWSSELEYWPSWSGFIARHREVHLEKKPHFSKQLALGCWKLKITYLQVWGLSPWIFTLRLKYSQQCQNFYVIECGRQRPTSKQKMKSIRPLTLQLGHVIERCIKIDRWSNMVKIWQFLPFLPVSSSELEYWPSWSCFIAGHRDVHQEKKPHLNHSPKAAESWK